MDIGIWVYIIVFVVLGNVEEVYSLYPLNAIIAFLELVGSPLLTFGFGGIMLQL